LTTVLDGVRAFSVTPLPLFTLAKDAVPIQ
jgi:hypothetical protein